jgi:hypothetical protein
MSISHACTHLPCFLWISIVYCRAITCYTHECCGLNPAWLRENIRFSSAYCDSLFCTTLSTTFSQKLVRDIGRCAWGSLRLVASFGMRKMCALLSACGICCALHRCCTSLIVISRAGFPPCLIRSAVIPSGPGAFPFAILLIISCISSCYGVLVAYWPSMYRVVSAR